jgi:hypothetical protein
MTTRKRGSPAVAARERSRARRKAQIGSGVAGASTGTGIIALIELIPDNSPFRNIVLYLAPSATVVASVAWAHMETSVKSWLDDRRIKHEAHKARQLAKRIDKDPHATESHKSQMRQEAERLDVLVMQVHRNRVEAFIAIDKIERADTENEE